jgi:hypothetical protein
MALLLGILIPLVAIFVCAVMFGLRRRRRRGVTRSHDVNSAARAARAAADARGASGLGPPGGPGGVPGGGIGTGF